MKQQIITLLMLLMANFTFAQTSTAPAAGDGTVGNPYQIATLDNLYWLSQTTTVWGSNTYFIQTADIDATSTASWDDAKGFKPIGRLASSKRFDASYDGNGKSISNLSINRPLESGVGLFGYVSQKISNLRLINANITGQTFVGALVGWQNYGTVKKCSSSGIVSGTGYDVGGLIGNANENIEQSYSSANVLVASNQGGGLVGSYQSRGGFYIKNCYATGSVTGGASAQKLGGLIGKATGASTIQYCYSTGAVSATAGTDLGGLIGSLTDAAVTSCYWDTQTSTMAASAAGTAKTTAQMQTVATFINWDFEINWAINGTNYPSFDFRLPTFGGGAGTVENPYLITSYRHLDQLSQFPVLWSASFSQTSNINASASATTPFDAIGYDAPFTGTYNGNDYSIDGLTTAFASGAGGLFANIKTATLSNINLTNANISSMYMVGGVVGYAEASTITNCSVSGNISAITIAGGIIGSASNTNINKCSANVVVGGNPMYGEAYLTHFGGLVGLVNDAGTPITTISNSFAQGTVSAYNFVGGLVGGVDMASNAFGGGPNTPSSTMGFTMTNCYAANTFTVFASGAIAGGIFGQSNYVNSNNAITITNSFWDAEVSVTNQGYIGGTGKTNAEMKTLGTYTDWDFATIWKIDASSNGGMPNFVWQNTPIENISTATSASSEAFTPSSNIIISSTGSLIVDQNTDVNTLTVQVGGKLTVNSGRTLDATVTLESSALGTGTLVDNYTNPTLTATVQQYLPQGRNWYISVPTSSGNTSSFIGAGLATSVSYYNEVGGAWVDDYTGAMTPGIGYVAISAAGAGSATNNTSFSGTLNSGNVPVTLTRTGTSGFAGYNLIANPYPSFVNPMAALNALNVEKTIWYRTKGATYKFETVNIASGVGTNAAGTGQVTGYIPPFQAFWVRTNVTGQVLTFTNAMREHANPSGVTTTLLKAPSAAAQAIARLKINGNTGTDETVLYFNTAASNSFDDYDSRKMFENEDFTIPEIYTQVGNEKLVINGLNTVQYETEIPLGFVSKQAGDFSISVNEFSNFASGTRLILKDKLYPTKETELSTEMAYNFSESTATASSNRFSLLFRAPGVATGFRAAEKLNAQVFVNAANQISIVAPEKANYAIYNTVGMLLENGTVNSKLQTASCKLQTGIYVVELSANGEKLTTRVIIK